MSLRDGLLLRGGGVVSLVGAGGKTSLMFKLARELSTAGETVLTTTTTKIYTPSPQQSPWVITSESVTNILDQAGDLPLIGNWHDQRRTDAVVGRVEVWHPSRLIFAAPPRCDRVEIID